jgi:hypothetical protein
MPQTAISMAQVMKEAWTADRLQKQFEDKNAPLGRIESIRGVMIGRQAQTPVWGGRSGASTSVGAGGGNLNPASQQPTAQALWTLVYQWFQIELDTSAIAQASGQSAQSIVGGKDLEIEGAVENQKHQMTRQIVTNGDGIVAAFGTTASANVLNLVNAAGEGASYGYSALVRGWLFPGQPVDIGTVGDSDALATEAPISAVDYSNPAAPTLTITGAPVATTAGTHFGYIPNPNSPTAANPELNGLRQIIGSGALGGLNSATAGQEYWRGAFRDTTTTTFSLDLPLNLQRYILQNSNEPGTAVWTGYRQQANFYSLLQNQITYASDGDLAAGSVSKPTWNGMSVDAFADILDTDWFQLTLSDLVRVKSALDKPTWASDIEGAGGSTRWKQGTTRFVDGVVYPMQLGVQRRNTQAGATALK